MANFTVTTLIDEAFGGGDLAAETGDGAGLSLREALALANTNDEPDSITFDSVLDGQITLGGSQLEITTDGITIDGDANGDGVGDITIDGDGASRVFLIDDGSVITTISATLNNLTIANGSSATTGGGILVNGGDRLTLTNTTVRDNTAASLGGGVLVQTNGAVVIENSAIVDNTGAGGGGIGGISGSTITLVNTTLSGNATSGGASGGGISTSGEVSLLNTTVSGNTTGAAGGGIALVNGTATLVNATVTGNKAERGGGITAFSTTSSEVTIANSIVAGNAGTVTTDDLLAEGPGTGNLTFLAGNLIGSGATGFDTVTGTATVQIDGTEQGDLQTVFATVGSDPDTGVISGLLADNGGPVRTVALARDNANPAIDAGDPDALDETLAGIDLNGDGDQLDTMVTDARGAARDVDFDGANGTPDLGAFETQRDSDLVVTILADSGEDATVSGDLAAEQADGGGLSLREALLLANLDFDRDSTNTTNITFDAGLAGNTLTLTNGGLTTTRNVSIDGDTDGDGDADITISGNNAGRILLIDDGDGDTTITAALNGLVIRDGDVLGGIRIGGSDALILTHSTVTGNTGPGISAQSDASITLDNAMVTDNQARGISGSLRTTLSLNDSVIAGNSTIGDGGGIFVSVDSTIVAVNSTIADNSANSSGGISGNGEITLVNSTVSGNNAATFGGGIVYAGAITLINVTVSGNSAGTDGGGIRGYNDDITLVNSTVTGNSAGTNGAGIFNFGSGGHVALVNSIVAGNAADDAGDDLYGFGGGLGSADITFTGGNIIGSAPQGFDAETGAATVVIDGASQGDLEKVFAAVGNDADTGVLSGTLANNGGPVETVALVRRGEAHNAGVNALLPADVHDLDHDADGDEALPLDARGQPRTFDATVDVGAFELQEVFNLAPVARNDAFATDEATAINGAASVFANNGSGADSDGDGDILAVTAVNGNAYTAGVPLALPSGALLTMNADGTFTYDPNGQFDTLSAPGTGGITEAEDSFTYTIGDGNGGEDTATVSVTVIGLDGDDNLQGTDGNDILDGGAGDDVLAGGKGNDKLKGGNGDDTLAGDGGKDKLKGGKGNDVLDGGAGKDELKGGGGKDILDGGAGGDKLKGGGGKDIFVFDDPLGGGNVDRIQDFKPGKDVIHLAKAVFPGIGKAGDFLPGKRFDIGNKADDKDDRIVYDRKTGDLFFDRDGSKGGHDPIKFARLDKGLDVSADDFLVV